jgi:hypothetical protein
MSLQYDDSRTGLLAYRLKLLDSIRQNPELISGFGLHPGLPNIQPLLRLVWMIIQDLKKSLHALILYPSETSNNISHPTFRLSNKTIKMQEWLIVYTDTFLLTHAKERACNNLVSINV